MQNLVRREGNPFSDMLEDFLPVPRNFLSGILAKDLEGNLIPSVDVEETDEGYLIRAELPGLAKEDIAVNIDDGVLTISGEKKKVTEKKTRNYFHMERSYGKFSRSFALPAHVDSKNIGAKYQNGILEVSLLRTEETKPKGIEVKIV